ncbi:unnamed protein product [Effrenium voratum]|uniref:Uncharacterized protein n=1 Tax=Effrenium voratum TaxID=2562239 RepID=A0AA36JRW6_9DINO|nr:unnamed protein product [Effrenium voratum]
MASRSPLGWTKTVQMLELQRPLLSRGHRASRARGNAMSSDLTEFLATLLRIARFVLDVTLTAICVVLLALALCVLWRIPAIVGLLTKKKFKELKDFQAFCGTQFLCSVADVFLFAFVAPSVVWPLRWRQLAKAMKKVSRGRGDDDDGYNVSDRTDLVESASESYADLVLAPLALLALLLFWRLAPAHREKLWPQWQHFEKCLSQLRNWAAKQGLHGLLDLGFVAYGLVSLLVPSRMPGLWNVLWAKEHFKDRRDSCEARGYLLLLPFVSLAELLSILLALAALANPLRSRSLVHRLSGSSSRGSSSRARTPNPLLWDAELRVEVAKVGLASLLDLLLLPMGLIVCLSVYRAGPLVSALRFPATELEVEVWVAEPEPDAGDATEAAASGPSAGAGARRLVEDTLPVSRVHRAALVQFCLLGLDLLTLPCALLVLLTWYRVSHVSEDMKWVSAKNQKVAYHLAVVWNSLFVLHDGLLGLCCLSLVLSVYRLPRAWRAAFPPEGQLRDRPRREIWQEIGHLLLDLPLLPLLLILLVTLWRADLVLAKLWQPGTNCEKRRAVLVEFLELARDVLGFLALLLLAVTLVRLPKALLDIYAQRARQVKGDPRLRVRRLRLRCPEHTEADRRLVFQAEAVQDDGRLRQDLGVLRINVISASFWEELGRSLGSSIASLGQALMPFLLKDGQHLKYSDFLHENATIELRMGGKGLKEKILQLEESITMCVQIEHKAPDGAEEVLTRLPIPMSLLHRAVRTPGDFVEVEEQVLTSPLESVCGPLLAGAGVRAALWLCAFRELWQLILDLLHLVLFALLILAPWRLVQCTYVACRPNQVWMELLRRQTLGLLRFKSAMLRRYQKGLEPALNAAAKDPPARTSKRLQQVAAAERARTPLPTVQKERALLSELRRQGSEAFVEKARLCSSLQDAAASYWPTLAFGANLQLLKKKFNPQEHALALEKICAASGRAERLAMDLARDLEAGQAPEGAEKGGCLRAACGKSLVEHRRLVQIFAAELCQDYAAFVLGSLLLVTFYRVPTTLGAVFCGEREAGGPPGASRSPLVQRLRIVLNCQVRLLASDIWMLLTTGLACLCALLTLVRALEFLKASLHCGSLAELRSCAWDSSCEALGALWELLALLFFWDSYKTLVRSAVCALLLPAWGLLLLPHGLRILLWLGLCALPWTLPLHWVLRSLAAVEAVFFLVALLRRRAAAAQEAVPAHMKTLRISGMNALALISLVVDAVLLSSLDVLAPTLRQEGWLYGAVAVTALWLLVISLPHAMSKDESSEKDCLSSGKFHVGMQLLRRLLLPAAIVFSVQVLAGEMALDDAYGASARGACLGLAFLTFTTVLGLDLHTHAQDHLPDSVGLDIVQPSAFLGGLLFAQLLFLNRALEQNMEGGSGLYPAVTSLLMPAWVLGYAALGGSLGGPLWLWPLQLGAALAPAWGAWTAALKLNENVTWAGFAGLCFLSLCGASLVELLASRWRRAALEKAGVPQLLSELWRKLAAKGALLGVVEAPEGDLSPWALAQRLARFEEACRMERLSVAFLERRKLWLAELRAQSNSYEVVAKCGQELLAAVTCPPSTVQIFLLMKRGKGRRVPNAVWQMILEFVGDVRFTSKLLDPVVNHFSGGSPAEQLLRGWRAMDEVGDFLAKAHELHSAPLELQLTQATAKLDQAVQVELASGRQSFQWPDVMVSKQVLEEKFEAEIAAWLRSADRLFSTGCRCGRSLHPSTRQGLLHCFRLRHYSACCGGCAHHDLGRRRMGRGHSAACDARALEAGRPGGNGTPLSGPRTLQPGCPPAAFG